MRFSLDAEPGPILLLMRHGKTKDNTDKDTKVRGWKDLPLSKEGEFEVQLFSYRLMPYAPKAIYHSDFLRDSQTAHILAGTLGISDVSPDYNARTWDTGLLSGQPEEDAEPVIAEIYKNPWQKAPGGSESLSDFFSRSWSFLEKKMDLAAKVPEMRPILVVTHGRNLATAHSYITSSSMEQGLMPKPGGFAVISIEPDRSLSIDIPGEKETILRDV